MNTQNTNYYLAITIGPIHKTMLKARAGRELWSVSFSFSLLMKCLIEEFEKLGKLLSPSLTVKYPLHGAGVYPDRCFIELTKPLLPETIKTLKAEAIKKFCLITGFNLSETEFFQVYAVQKSITDQPINKLNEVLDAIELSGRYFNSPPNDISKYWNNSDSASFFQTMYKEGYGPGSILPDIKAIYSNKPSRLIKRFKSIPEIATTELEKINPINYWNALGIQYIKTPTGEINFEQLKKDDSPDDENEDIIIDTLKGAFDKEFKFRHKYFAIVQADGDNVGALIHEIEKSGGCITSFSDALNSFVAAAAEVLVKYGAFPIYMGGDDLLFFAPITNYEAKSISIDFNNYLLSGKSADNIVEGNNIFFLLTSLSNLFKDKLDPVVSRYPAMKNMPLSLSFGVSVGYYKKPMNEILEESYDLLFRDAKGQPCKDYVAVELEKHSGQSFSFGFTQHTKLYYHFLKLCTVSKNKDANFLNSVMYSIKNQRHVILSIEDDKDTKGNDDDIIMRLSCFFEENFNEANHIQFRPFFKEVVQIIHETFKYYAREKPKDSNSEDNRLSRVYCALRFVHFLNAKDNHE